MIRIALAQQDFPVGDMTGNLARAKQSISTALEKGADLILFPEMAISGYPPEDLLLRPGFMHRCHDVVEELVNSVQGIDVVIGHPWAVDNERFNAVSWIRDGVVLGRYFKQALPNYAVLMNVDIFLLARNHWLLISKELTWVSSSVRMPGYLSLRRWQRPQGRNCFWCQTHHHSVMTSWQRERPFSTND